MLLYRRNIILLFCTCLFLIITSFLYADTIYLKNGNKVEGIIIKEDGARVEIKIHIGGTVSFSRDVIERIEKDSDLERRQIEDAWKREKESREKERIAGGTERKEKKGLVEYKGKWVTPEEKERLQAAGVASSADKGIVEEKVFYKEGKGRLSKFAAGLLSIGEWYRRETENFIIYYSDASQSKIVSDKAEYYFEKIIYDLGYEGQMDWKEKCSVYIVENVEKWRMFLKGIGFNPDLVGGFVPNYKNREMFLCAISDSYLAVTFPHELTHLIFRGIAGNSTIPLWLNEGLANYEASITSISNKLLTGYIKEGRHILLGDLLRMSNYPQGKETRELFYAESEKLVEFLIVKYGRKKFRRFCDLILKDRSFSDALFSVYSDDFKDIEDFNVKLVEYIIR